MSRKTSTEIENQIIDLITKGLKVKEVAETLKVSKATISRLTLKNGLRQKGKYIHGISEEEMNTMVNMHLSGKSFKFIEKTLKRSHDAVKTALASRGYYNNGKEGSNRIHNVDINVFNIIDSEEKAYWLGVLMADGYNDEKNYKVTLTQAENNKELVYKFKIFLKSEHPVYINKRSLKNPNWQDAYSLNVTSKTLSKTLSEKGIVQAKSSICKFPEIPQNLYNHFIRGYFDGDGYIGKNRFELCGTKEMIEKIQEILIVECNLNKTKLKQRHCDRNNNNYDLIYGGRLQLNKIYNYLYQNATVYLKRKMKNFTLCLNQELFN